MIDIWHPDVPATTETRPLLRRRLLQTEESRPLVMICPGGGYTGLADHEALNVAEAFNDQGFHAAVLYYRLAPDHQHPAMIHDIHRAVRIIRHFAESWGVSQHMAVLGFSAGGHLASCAATLYDQFTCEHDDLACTYSARPDAAVLCYPVIDLMNKHLRHSGSRRNLLGDQHEDDTLAAQLSTSNHINANTPPCFLWHTAADTTVLMDNSLEFASVCRKHNVPVELHVYEQGGHGMGLAEENRLINTWVKLAGEFLNRHLLINEA